MDIYSKSEKATTNVPLGKNKGVVVSNLSVASSPDAQPFDLFTYGATGGLTVSNRFIIPESCTYLIPIKAWGISFDSTKITAFGVS